MHNGTGHRDRVVYGVGVTTRGVDAYRRGRDDKGMWEGFYQHKENNVESHVRACIGV